LRACKRCYLRPETLRALSSNISLCVNQLALCRLKLGPKQTVQKLAKKSDLRAFFSPNHRSAAGSVRPWNKEIITRNCMDGLTFGQNFEQSLLVWEQLEGFCARWCACCALLCCVVLCCDVLCCVVWCASCAGCCYAMLCYLCLQCCVVLCWSGLKSKRLRSTTWKDDWFRPNIDWRDWSFSCRLTRPL
jgi:hypothetical protein